MLIEDVMTTEYRTVPRSESLDAAVGVILRSSADAVIVVDEDPCGLITERKALIAAYKTDDPLTEIPLSGFASGFDRTVAPDATVLFTIGRFVGTDATVFPVMDGLDLVGVVSRSDLLDEYSNLRNEAFETVQQRTDWDTTPEP